MTDNEYVTIVGHYNRSLQGSEIDPRLLTRGFTEEQLKQIKRKSKSKSEIISCNLHIKGNLDKFDYPYFSYVLKLFDKYSNHGVLPFPGTHSEQPSKILEIFDLLEALDLERKEAQQREHEKKQRTENRKRR